jgi:hypothetical protein
MQRLLSTGHVRSGLMAIVCAIFALAGLAACSETGASGVNTPPVTAITQPYYTVRLDSFKIDRLRAVDSDTDTVAFALQVNGRDYPNQSRDMGDVNDGVHPVGLAFTHVPISSGDTVKIALEIVNAGHVNRSELLTRLYNGVTALKDKAKGYCENDPSVMTCFIAAGGYAISYLIQLLTGYCNGPVALDATSLTGDDVKSLTQQGAAPYAHTKTYPGTDSNWGCGKNSIYEVTWSITPEPSVPLQNKGA